MKVLLQTSNGRVFQMVGTPATKLQEPKHAQTPKNHLSNTATGKRRRLVSE